MLLDCCDDALAGELVETIRHVLLLVAQSTKHIGILARIQKPNDVNVLVPTVLGVQAALLHEVEKFTSAKVLIQGATTLSRMRLDQRLKNRFTAKPSIRGMVPLTGHPKSTMFTATGQHPAHTIA